MTQDLSVLVLLKMAAFLASEGTSTAAQHRGEQQGSRPQPSPRLPEALLGQRVLPSFNPDI